MVLEQVKIIERSALSLAHRYIIFPTQNVQRLFTHISEIAQLSSAITSSRRTDTQKPSCISPNSCIPADCYKCRSSSGQLISMVTGHERMHRPSGLSEMELSYAGGKRDPSNHEGVSA